MLLGFLKKNPQTPKTPKAQNTLGDGCTPRGTPRSGQGRAPPGKCWGFSNFCCLRCPGRPARAPLRSAPPRRYRCRCRCRWARRGLGRRGAPSRPAGGSAGASEGREPRRCGLGLARGCLAWASPCRRGAAVGSQVLEFGPRCGIASGPPRVRAPTRAGARRAGGTRRGRGRVCALLLLPPGAGGAAGSPQAFRRRPPEFGDMSWKLLPSGRSPPAAAGWLSARDAVTARRRGGEGRGRPSSPATPGGSVPRGWPAPRAGRGRGRQRRVPHVPGCPPGGGGRPGAPPPGGAAAPRPGPPGGGAGPWLDGAPLAAASRRGAWGGRQGRGGVWAGPAALSDVLLSRIW